jgi:ribosome maturation factor RimP
MPDSKNSDQAIKKVTELTDEVVKSLGFELVDIHFGQHGRQKIVEITIYNPHGSVGLSDCETVSRQLDTRIDAIADQLDFFHGPFILDVASPGIDRVLKSEREYKLFCGRKVEIKTKTNVGADPYGQHFIARLAAFDSESFSLTELGPVQSAPTKSKNSKKHAANKVLQEPVKELKVALKQVIQIRLYPDLQKKLKEISTTDDSEIIDLNIENKVEVERD